MKEKQEGVGKHFRIKVLCNDVTTKYHLYAVSWLYSGKMNLKDVLRTIKQIKYGWDIGWC